jgi:hypothetical protein
MSTLDSTARQRNVETNAARFERQVSFAAKHDCWLWNGTISNVGYGQLHIKFGLRQYRLVLAHRFSWELFRCQISNDVCVLHRCDNPRCVNPHHLFLGSMKDNTMDMIAKGRAKFFGGKGKKLCKEQAELAARLYNDGRLMYQQIGDIFGVSRKTVARAVSEYLNRSLPG